MKKALYFLPITLLFIGCSGNQKTVCDCLAEETAYLKKSSKTDYKDYKSGEGLSEECKELEKELTSDSAKEVTYKAQRKECPEYSEFNDETNKMLKRVIEIEVEKITNEN